MANETREDRELRVKIESLTKQLEQAKEQKAQAEGAIKQLMKQLKEGFGVNSQEEAEEKIEELRKHIEATRKDVAAKLAALTKEYGL